MKLEKFFNYLMDNKVSSRVNLDSELIQLKRADFHNLSHVLSQIETSKVNLLIFEEVIQMIHRNPDMEKNELKDILSEMLLCSTGYVSVNLTISKKAKLISELIQQLASNRF